MPGTETFQCDSFGCFSPSITSLNALATLLEVFFNILWATHAHAHTHTTTLLYPCCTWKLLLLEISTSICSPRCALTTVHQSFLCLWDSITGPHEEFLTKSIPVCLCLLTKFVGTCSERI